jgi:hypothetical protein
MELKHVIEAMIEHCRFNEDLITLRRLEAVLSDLSRKATGAAALVQASMKRDGSYLTSLPVERHG